MYYVITKGGVRKWQFLIMFSTESNHKGEGKGGQKTPNLDYVIHGWSLGLTDLPKPGWAIANPGPLSPTSLFTALQSDSQQLCLPTFSSSVWALSLLHRFSIVILYANNKTKKTFGLKGCTSILSLTV